MKVNRNFISKKNTYEGKNNPKYIIVHETDNFRKGADARAHASAQAAGHLDTSVHYYVDELDVYQAAEHQDGTYSIGREYGGNHAITDANNRNTINIEICVNEDGNYSKAREHAIELVKYLIQTTGIPASQVIRHFDAKGKYCPRKMMDNPSLWEDFRAKIGDVVTVQPEPAPEQEKWYRVGTGWKNGICQNQTGAYYNLNFAIADCKAGENVYDWYGNIVHSGGQITETGYTQKQFIRDVQAATGSKVDGFAGDETIGNTITVSRKENKNHEVVTHLERRLKALGFYDGVIEADEGSTPNFGLGMEKAVNEYQKQVNGKKKPDGEITARQRMWKSLLGMI